MVTFRTVDYEKKKKPGRVIRCVSQAEIFVFDGFSLMVTDGRTSGHTDGQTLLWRCEDLGKKPSESVRRGKSSQSIGSGNVRAGEGGNLLVIPIFWQKVGKKGKELYELQRGRGRSVGG